MGGDAVQAFGQAAVFGGKDVDVSAHSLAFRCGESSYQPLEVGIWEAVFCWLSASGRRAWDNKKGDRERSPFFEMLTA
jgi:hypothetical protein